MLTSLPLMQIRKNQVPQHEKFTNYQQSIQNVQESICDLKPNNLQGQQDLLLSSHRNNATMRFKHKMQYNQQHRNSASLAFKQIEDYSKVSENLDLMQKLKKVNSQKLKKLQKNASNINFLRKMSLKQSLKIQNHKQKLQQTQMMVFYLDNLQKSKQKIEEQKWIQRKQMCMSLRETNEYNKELTKSVFKMSKQAGVKKFRQKNIELLTKRERNLDDILQQNRRKAEDIRSSQYKLKQKLKKYQDYKVYLGRLNYSKKLQGQYKKHQHNQRYLAEVKQKVKEEDKLFRKTQRLKRQSKKIEEFYLTGTGTD